MQRIGRRHGRRPLGAVAHPLDAGAVSFAADARLSCSYTFDPTSLDQGPGGGNARLTLTTRDTCAWTVTASESWIKVVTPSGTGSGVINLNLDFNSSSADRRGYITIAGLRVDVVQRRNDL